MSHKLAISFPRMGNYDIPIQNLIQALFPGQRVFPAPPMTDKTIELGSRHSPDFVCAPFKYNIGNYIEALEAGANVLLQTGMGCRYGYYGELQEQILRDLGYSFRFLCFSRDKARPVYVYRTLKKLGSPLSAPKMLFAFARALYVVRVMDRFAFTLRKQACLEKMPGTHDVLHQSMLDAIGSASSFRAIHKAGKQSQRQLKSIPLRKKEKPLRVGLIGELYTLMEPFSNCNLERELIRHGLSVSRRMSVTFLLFGKRDWLSLRRAGRYLRYAAGANGVDSVAQAKWYMKRRYDGIIHMKSFGCTPELNVMPALQNLSRDYGVPVMHLSFDSHTGQTGVQTRLEAFCDMLAMRREKDARNRQFGRGHRFHIHQRRTPGPQ